MGDDACWCSLILSFQDFQNTPSLVHAFLKAFILSTLKTTEKWALVGPINKFGPRFKTSHNDGICEI